MVLAALAGFVGPRVSALGTGRPRVRTPLAADRTGLGVAACLAIQLVLAPVLVLAFGAEAEPAVPLARVLAVAGVILGLRRITSACLVGLGTPASATRAELAGLVLMLAGFADDGVGRRHLSPGYVLIVARRASRSPATWRCWLEQHRQELARPGDGVRPGEASAWARAAASRPRRARGPSRMARASFAGAPTSPSRTRGRRRPRASPAPGRSRPGSPSRMPSTTGRPKPSKSEGNSTRAAPAIVRLKSASARNGASVTAPARPRRSTPVWTVVLCSAETPRTSSSGAEWPRSCQPSRTRSRFLLEWWANATTRPDGAAPRPVVDVVGAEVRHDRRPVGAWTGAACAGRSGYVARC